MNERLLTAIARAARSWRDPAYPARVEAVDRTLTLENRFTPEALAFAINQQMHLLREPDLEAWVNGRSAPESRRIGVLSAGNLPFVELQDFLAVILLSHAYRGVLSSKSPYLLPAFVKDVRRNAPDLDVQFLRWEELLSQVDAIIATGTDETRDEVAAACDAAQMAPRNRLLRGNGFGVAVLDGSEDEDELEGLAEDALLHEGLGCRNVALIWAPAETPPDRLLEAMAHFRAVFPAHEQTTGALAMPRAFLDAVGASHAYGEGLEFLLSKGDPEVQQPGHLRWAEYRSLEEPVEWIQQQFKQIQVVVASERVARLLPPTFPLIRPGEAQRPPLDWKPDGKDVIEFLTSLE